MKRFYAKLFGALTSYNAANDVFFTSSISPLLKILMCWFHVKFNIKKRFHFYELHDMVINEIYKLHYCKTYEVYQQLKTQVLDKWSSIPSLANFKNYFEEHWINSVFNKYLEVLLLQVTQTSLSIKKKLEKTFFFIINYNLV